MSGAVFRIQTICCQDASRDTMPATSLGGSRQPDIDDFLTATDDEKQDDDLFEEFSDWQYKFEGINQLVVHRTAG